MKYELHEGAQGDFDETVQYHRGIDNALGRDLSKALRHSFKRIARSPEALKHGQS